MTRTWIAYEHCDRTNGECGIRGRTPNDRAEEITRLRNDPKKRIIAEGLNYDDATNLIALTPEICRLTDAVDDLFGNQNHLDEEGRDLIINFLIDAYGDIIADRESRMKSGLTPKENYLDVFVDVNAGDTGKYLVFRKMTSLFEVKQDGTLVDLKEAVLSLAKELISVALQEQIAVWKKERETNSQDN
jgi:hypothetical protein